MQNKFSISKFYDNKEGSMNVMFAISLLASLAAIGAVVDIANLHENKRRVQNSLDASVLAAVQNPDFSNEQINDLAEAIFENNLQLSEEANLSLSITRGENGLMDASASFDQPLVFGALLGADSQKVGAEVQVKFLEKKEAEETPVGAGHPCIMTLSNDDRTALLLNGGAQINSEVCDVHVHSTGRDAIIVNNRATLNTPNICLAGESYISNAGPIENLETNCAVKPNPFAAAFPEPDDSCDYWNGNYNSRQVTLQPGVYCGWHNFNNGSADVTFQPGTYVLRNGGWNVNGGEWTGDGVTFYFSDTSKIQFNSGVKADLKAPASGDFKGVVFAEKEGLGQSDFTLNDAEGFDVQGNVYLPSRNVTFNSQSQLEGRGMNFIVNRMIINQANLDIVNAPAVNADVSEDYAEVSGDESTDASDEGQSPLIIR